MSFIKLQFRPGINRDTTNYSNEGGWYETDKVRFRSGYPEKIGGWEKRSPTPIVGYCRQMWGWITTFGDRLLALGTNVKVYIGYLDDYFDITPLRDSVPTLTTPDTDSSISTTLGSNIVTFTLAVPHLIVDPSYVVISGIPVSTIGGIPSSEINGNHLATPMGVNIFTITVPTVATSSVAGAGGAAITIDFEIPPGFPINTLGFGWGTGTWGRGTWGSGANPSVTLGLRDWWFDNFDNDLVMNIRNGQGYWWRRGIFTDPVLALSTKAIRLRQYALEEGFDPDAVPSKIMQLLVSQQDKHLIAFGAVPFGTTDPANFDPLLIRWADQDTPGDWTPDALNTAGDIRVSRGSRIIRALPTRQEILVWTDTHLYAFQFLGTTDVFGLQEYADNVSIMSPRACVTASNVTYWMGKDKFYAYTGRVETLPCTLRDHVFSNINHAQSEQVICGTSEEWSEVWWFYPTADSDFNNAYVVYQHIDQVWYYGFLPRTAWYDTPLHAYPLACNTIGGENEGFLYSHEKGVDDDGLPMASFIQSSDFDIGEGDKFMLTRRMIPDLTFKGSTVANPEVTMQVSMRRFPGSPRVNEPTDAKKVIEMAVGEYTRQVFIRARSRQMALKISSENLGVKWSLGSPRLDTREDAQR